MNKKGVSLEEYPINFLWIALFIVVIISFAIGLGNLYGKSSEDMIGNQINVTIFEQKITSSHNIIGSDVNATLQDELNTDTNILTLKSMWGTFKNSWAITTGMWNILKSLVINVLHIPSIVFYAILSIFLIGLIYSIFKFIQGRK